MEPSHHRDVCFGSPANVSEVSSVSCPSPLEFTRPSVRVPAGRLSCYVFVCFGNGFQVAIVAYVTG